MSGLLRKIHEKPSRNHFAPTMRDILDYREGVVFDHGKYGDPLVKDRGKVIILREYLVKPKLGQTVYYKISADHESYAFGEIMLLGREEPWYLRILRILHLS